MKKAKTQLKKQVKNKFPFVKGRIFMDENMNKKQEFIEVSEKTPEEIKKEKKKKRRKGFFIFFVVFMSIILICGGVVAGFVFSKLGKINYDTPEQTTISPTQEFVEKEEEVIVFDDIDDATKPILWTFSQAQTQLLGLTYSVKNAEVYNDIQIVGDMLDNNAQPMARASNYDPKSDTNINIIFTRNNTS